MRTLKGADLKIRGENKRDQTVKRYCVKGFKYFFDPSTASDSPSFKAYSHVKEKFRALHAIGL